MESAVTDRSYTNRLRHFVSDQELQNLDLKYGPYLDIHKIEDIFSCFDIVQIPAEGSNNVKLAWDTDYDLPTELKRDIIELFNKYFAE